MQARSKDAVFSDPACVASHSYYLDHHGDASLAFAGSPWRRLLRTHFGSLAAFRFGPTEKGAG